MRISEEPFYSIQGEGYHCGLPAIFIRLAECNLKCHFCDSKFSWSEGIEITLPNLVKKVREFNCSFVVITGGEPLLQEEPLIVLLESLLDTSPFYFFEIETNGTITPTQRLLELIDSWVISPKLKNSGNEPYKIGEWFFEEHRGHKYLKFVVDTPQDLKEIQEYILDNENFGSLDDCNIFLMPQALTAEEHNRKLSMIIDFAKTYNYRVSPRLHILAFGNRKGV